MSEESQLAGAALDTLHGARAIPRTEAIVKLRDFLQSVSATPTDSARFAVAASALKTLVSALETKGAATDDDWQNAIETMLSLANEAS